MRTIVSLICSLLTSMVLLISCASVDNVEEIYNHGVERARKATTDVELYQISIDVKNELVEEANKIGGKNKMGSDDTRRCIEAEQKFYQAIEEASLRITGRPAQWDPNSGQ